MGNIRQLQIKNTAKRLLEIHGDKFRLLDRQASFFTPNKENERSLSFGGRTVKLPNFTLEEIRRGEKPEGYLVTIADSRGKIIQHQETSPWLFENLGNLMNLPVGAYMYETCTRVFPTGPRRTRY